MGLYIWKFGYRKILDPLAKRLAWLDPDIVSYAATGVAFFTGLCFIFAGKYPALLLLAILTIFLRMTLNTIDGVMAIQRGKSTLFGEIVNALPDRYSDVFLMLGLTLSPLVDTVLALLATVTVFLVSYTGMLGKAVGVNWQHHGPLGKVERLILVMIFALLQYIWGDLSVAGVQMSALSWCMLLFIVLGQITVLNRLRGQAGEITLLEWKKDPVREKASQTTLVIYDSHTGNTKQIAETIAGTLNAPCRKVDEAGDISGYSLIVFCSPNIRSAVTKKMEDFIRTNAAKINKFAAMITYGAPWGKVTNLLAVNKLARLINKHPAGSFFCKGLHVKFKTYKGHPNDREKEQAALFAIRTAKKVLANG